MHPPTQNQYIWFEKGTAGGNYNVSAFKSLSFKGKRGYSTDIIKKNTKNEQSRSKPTQSEHSSSIHPQAEGRTYGGIITTKTLDGKLKFALVQGRYTGKWSFPKGHSNKGEPPLDCTKREIVEETGIEHLPDPTDCLKIGYGVYYLFNLETEVELTPKDNNEIMSTKWATLDEMETMSLNADANYYRKQLKNN